MGKSKNKTGRSVRYVNMLKRLYRHADFLAKLTKLSFIQNRIEKSTVNDEMIYLTKDKVIPINQEVGKPTDMVLPSEVVEYFVNKTKYHWIMNFCICRDSLKCEDYPRQLGCLFMGEPVVGINPAFGSLVTKEEALEHLKKCREAGLVHVIGRNELDAKWLGIGPGSKLLTICNCCPCCCITRYAPKVKFVGNTLKKMSGVEIKVTDKCIGCGTCTKGVCFANAIQIIDKKAVINEECRGCGRCVDVCPQKAIELILNDNNFIKNSIKRIDEIVDLT